MVNTIKKLKRAVTLVELVVSISVSTIIFGGVSALLLYIRKTNNSLNNDISNIYSVNLLSHSIEEELDKWNGNFLNLPIEFTSFTSTQREGKDVILSLNEEKLFSVHIDGGKSRDYYFVERTFGYSEGSRLLTEIYSVNTDVKIDLTRLKSDESLFEFKFCYGDEFTSHISLIKNLKEISSNG